MSEETMSEEQRNRSEDMRERESEERLTTKDMAGAAAARARDESQPRESRDQHRQSTQQQPEPNAPLFDSGEAEEFRSRWMIIQTEFVDEPRRSVEEADELVATTMKRLAEIFARERDNLERELGSGDNVSTEDLRIALQRYRSFFDRLLSV